MKGQKNYYRCDTCHAYFVTLDADEGTTPAMVSCVVGTGRPCPGKMLSAFYPEVWPENVPDEVMAEWYKPSPFTVERMRKRAPKLAQHCINGGLILREARHVSPQ